MKNNMYYRALSRKMNVAIRFALAGLIALLGFTSCSRSLFGKRDKTAEDGTDNPIQKDGMPDVRIDPTRPPELPIRVLYGVPPRTYQWNR